jgi:hypothetical protein
MPSLPDNYPLRKVKDFAHGERLFGANNNRLSPKYSFLYHVYFQISAENPLTMYKPGDDTTKEVGMLVKSVELPKFDIETKSLNAYNQHINVQTGIKYNPIKIDFHDDSANVVRNFWEDYMTFYYTDSYNDLANAIGNTRNRYSFKSPFWGYQPRTQAPYLSSVKIYSLSMGRYSLYTLVNPVIDSWTHGTHTAGQNEFIGHSMSLRYEYVKYESGLVQDDPQFGNGGIFGFGGIHYDKQTSLLTQDYARTKGKTRDGGEVDYPPFEPDARTVQQQAERFELDPFARFADTKPRTPQQSTLASRLRASILRAGQSVVNSAIIKAQGRLRNIKIGNSTVNSIIQPALQNTVSQGASGLSNSIFPSPYK